MWSYKNNGACGQIFYCYLTEYRFSSHWVSLLLFCCYFWLFGWKYQNIFMWLTPDQDTSLALYLTFWNTSIFEDHSRYLFDNCFLFRMHVTHVIYDFDGLLVDTESCYTIANKRMLGKFGREYTPELNSSIVLPCLFKRFCCTNSVETALNLAFYRGYGSKGKWSDPLVVKRGQFLISCSYSYTEKMMTQYVSGSALICTILWLTVVSENGLG